MCRYVHTLSVNYVCMYSHIVCLCLLALIHIVFIVLSPYPLWNTGAVFGYVFTHIDEIKAKQKVAVERTMKQQANDLRNTQAAQRDAIDAALKKQDEAIRKINEEAKKRAEDAARRR